MAHLAYVDAKLAEQADAALRRDDFPTAVSEHFSSHLKVFLAATLGSLEEVRAVALRGVSTGLLCKRQDDIGPHGRPLGVDQLVALLKDVDAEAVRVGRRGDLAPRLERACALWAASRPNWHVVIAVFAGLANRGASPEDDAGDVAAAVWRAREGVDWLGALSARPRSRSPRRRDCGGARCVACGRRPFDGEELERRADEALRLAELAAAPGCWDVERVARELAPAVEALARLWPRRVSLRALGAKGDPWRDMEALLKQGRADVREASALLLRMLVEALRATARGGPESALALLKASEAYATRAAAARGRAAPSSSSSSSSSSS
jgi:hypothetical protein